MRFLAGEHTDLGSAGSEPAEVYRVQCAGGRGAEGRYVTEHEPPVKVYEKWRGTRRLTMRRHQGVLGLAHDPAAVCEQGVCWWHGYHDVDASGRQSGEAAGGEGCACAG